MYLRGSGRVRQLVDPESASRRRTAPGSPLHAQLLAFAPLTACVHAGVLSEWRAGRVATGDDAFPEGCLDVQPPHPHGVEEPASSIVPYSPSGY